jgi:hypothetical protein
MEGTTTDLTQMEGTTTDLTQMEGTTTDLTQMALNITCFHHYIAAKLPKQESLMHSLS